MPRIFSAQDYWDMAEAATEIRGPLYTVGRLTNVLIWISTLDDPYYMDISPATYMATLKDTA